ncbi:hypothetical protein SAY86_021618 [Trapa natans]|uniref:Uncharacterized protein n=1 Tax=Trapa natans TaxID=22666 RepID=A0AAN7MCP2_TRANT|nr:hypothetical protein SAY86_021618 [Trapa natans]
MDEYDCCRCFSDEEEEESNLKLDNNSPVQISRIKDDKRPGTEQLLGMDLHIQSMSLASVSSE